MFIIGVTGGTASGKTTLVSKIAEQFSKDEICIISQDAYYKDTTSLTPTERKAINFDHPDAIDFDLLATQMNALKNKETIKQPVYSFITHNRTSVYNYITPKNIVIVEGILICNDQRLLDLFDLTLFVHADANERLRRRIRRDSKERGRNEQEVRERYNKTLKPMHDKYIEPFKEKADIIVHYTTENTEIVRKLAALIRNKTALDS